MQESTQQQNVKFHLWPGQKTLINDHRHGMEHAVVAGNGYGKTMFGANWFFSRLMLNRNSPWSLIVAPKADLLKVGAVPFLIERLELAGYTSRKPFADFQVVGKPDEIRFAWGHTTLCRSVHQQAARRLVSVSTAMAWIDEPGLCPKIAFTEVAKRNRCPKAVCRQRLYTGTPEGINDFSEKFSGLKAAGERFSYDKRKLVLHGSTMDNRILPPDYLEALYAEFGYNENLIKAYIHGQFVPIYDFRSYDFDRTRQVKPCPFDRTLPLILSWDFNVSKGRLGGVSWVGMQEEIRDMNIIAENKEGSRTTDIAVRNFKEQFDPYDYGDHEIQLYGDASGYARDTRGFSNDWDVIAYELKQAGFNNVKNKVRRANPSEALRIACVNRMCSPAHHSKLYADPKCTKSIKSLEQTTIDENGKIKKPPGETHTHYADAIGYPVTILRPIVRPQAGQYTAYVEG